MTKESGTMSKKSKSELLEYCRERYGRRKREGKGAMIDELSEVMSWDRKHTIKAPNTRVAQGRKAQRRGNKARCDGDIESLPIRKQMIPRRSPALGW